MKLWKRESRITSASPAPTQLSQCSRRNPISSLSQPSHALLCICTFCICATYQVKVPKALHKNLQSREGQAKPQRLPEQTNAKQHQRELEIPDGDALSDQKKAVCPRSDLSFSTDRNTNKANHFGRRITILPLH